MDHDHIAPDHAARESACRALVPVDANRSPHGAGAAPRVDAGFLALLLAHRIGAETTRVRRRAAPDVARLAYVRGAALAGQGRLSAHSLRTV